MNFILGSGISAIILKLYDYNNKFQVIGDIIGGQFSSKFQLGPRILKSTEISDKFVKNFLSYKNISTYRIGYYYEGKLHNSCDKFYRIKYFKKTRGNNKSFEDSAMNDNQNILNGYDINFDDVNNLYKMIEKSFINKKIQKIDLTNKIILLDNVEMKFDCIINTIPINIFYKLCGIQKQIEYEKIYFYKVKNTEFSNEFLLNSKYDFIYFPEDFYPFHRITKIQDDYYCVEVMEKNNKNLFYYYDDVFILNNGHLKEDIIVENTNNIIHCGRYAKAVHNIRMHDIIKFAQEYFNE